MMKVLMNDLGSKRLQFAWKNSTQKETNNKTKGPMKGEHHPLKLLV